MPALEDWLSNLFGGSLTKPAMQFPGQEPQYFPNEAERAVAAAKAMQAEVQPQAPIMDQTVQSEGVTEETPTRFAPPSPVATPQFTRPDFRKETTDQYGNVRQSPALTKGGVLLNILRGGLQGGMDAIEGGALDAPQRGESKFGTGFAASRAMPIIRAQRAQNRERGNLLNEEARINHALAPLRIATQEAQLQNLRSEMNYRDTHAQYLKSTAAQKDQQSLQQLHAKAVEEAISRGEDPNTDPKVQAYADAITGLQRPTAQRNTTPFVEWRLANPDASIEEYFNLENRSRARYREDKDGETPAMKTATRGQLAGATVRKNRAQRALTAQYRFVPETEQWEDVKTGERISPEEYTKRKQDIQDAYEEEVSTLTGNVVDHHEYDAAEAKNHQGGEKAAKPKIDISKATKVAANPKTGEKVYLVNGAWYDAQGNKR